MLSFSFGPLALSMNQFLIALAFLVAWLSALFLVRRDGLQLGSRLLDLLLVALLAARIGFVIRYFPEYSHDWLGMLDIRDGGFSPLAGVAGGALFALYLFRRYPASREMLAASLGIGVVAWSLLAGTVFLLRDQTQVLADTPLQTLAGETRRPAAIRPGRPRVVNLWASWCPPCVREMPMLERAVERYPAVTFVFVNQGEGAKQVRRFLDEQGLTLPNVLLDPRGAFGRKAGSQVMPTTLFYDASGQLIDSHVGALSRASLASALEGFDAQYLRENSP